jgi:hypothetical protein
MAHLWLPTVLSFAIASSPALADSFVVTVKAVDAQKQPVAKADASLYWEVKEKAMVPRADRSGRTDSTGRAVMRIDNWNERRPLLVLSADRKLGGIIGVSKADDGKELTVTLAPTVQLEGRLTSTELKHAPEWASAMVFVDGFRAYFASDSGKSAEFRFVLPAGKYKLWLDGADVADRKETISLNADKPRHDLGTLDLKATPIARLKGKTPLDLTVTDARGVPRGVKLSDFKGKWVYLEFWGYW